MLTILFALIAATVLEGHRYWYESENSPAQCLFDDLQGNVGGKPAIWMAVNLVLLPCGYCTATFRLYKADALDAFVLEKPVEKLDSIHSRVRDSKSTRISESGIKAYAVSTVLLLVSFVVLAAKIVYIAVAATLGSDMISLCFGLLWFVYGVVNIHEDRNIAAGWIDANENEWGFGQILAVLLLSSITLTFRDLYTGEIIFCLVIRSESKGF